MYKLTFFIAALLMLTSCGDKTKTKDDFSTDAAATSEESTTNSTDAATYDPNRGIGKHSSVDLGAKLDEAMAAEGDKIQSVKCSSCHKLTDERLVGPGWKGVTKRQKPEWIMNFITNPDPMIDKDPELHAQLALFLVIMPHHSFSASYASSLLDFMLNNSVLNYFYNK